MVQARTCEKGGNPETGQKEVATENTGGERPDGSVTSLLQTGAGTSFATGIRPTFPDSSYRFKPGQNTRQTGERAKGCYKEGNIRRADQDLGKYFNTVNHALLIKRARETIKDEGVTDLIKKFLKSGVMMGA
jgi:RNA-directed DNA polymerase